MSKNGIFKIHLEESKEAAPRLFNATTSVIPDTWQSEFSMILTKEILNFGFHARAAIEMSNLEDSDLNSSIDVYPVKFSIAPDGERETNFRHALNGILHARHYIFGWSHSDHRILFSKNQNLIPTYITIKTDKFGPRVISIYGMSYVYLNTVYNKLNNSIYI